MVIRLASCDKLFSECVALHVHQLAARLVFGKELLTYKYLCLNYPPSSPQ